jgi:hypothetical protein
MSGISTYPGPCPGVSKTCKCIKRATRGSGISTYVRLIRDHGPCTGAERKRLADEAARDASPDSSKTAYDRHVYPIWNTDTPENPTKPNGRPAGSLGKSRNPYHPRANAKSRRPPTRYSRGERPYKPARKGKPAETGVRTARRLPTPDSEGFPPPPRVAKHTRATRPQQADEIRAKKDPHGPRPPCGTRQRPRPKREAPPQYGHRNARRAGCALLPLQVVS